MDVTSMQRHCAACVIEINISEYITIVKTQLQDNEKILPWKNNRANSFWCICL